MPISVVIFLYCTPRDFIEFFLPTPLFSAALICSKWCLCFLYVPVCRLCLTKVTVKQWKWEMNLPSMWGPCLSYGPEKSLINFSESFVDWVVLIDYVLFDSYLVVEITHRLRLLSVSSISPVICPSWKLRLPTTGWVTACKVQLRFSALGFFVCEDLAIRICTFAFLYAD